MPRLRPGLVAFWIAGALSMFPPRPASAVDPTPPPEAGLATSVSSGKHVDGDVTFVATSRLSPPIDEIPVGSEFDVFLELTSQGEGVRVDLGPIPQLKLSDNLQVLDTASGRRRQKSGEYVTHFDFFRFTLKGVRPGKGTVYPAEIQYRLEGEDTYQALRTPELSVSIVRPQAAGPPLWQKLGVAIGIPLLALFVLAWILVRRAKGKRQSEDTEQAQKPWWDEALDEARRRRYEGDPRAYLEALWDVLRRGLAEEYGLTQRPALSLLKDRIEESEGDEELRRSRVGLLNECETARYAPEVPPPEDLDRLAKRIREVLE
jgi:hypothetical protein